MNNKNMDKLISLNEQFMKVVIDKLDRIENLCVEIKAKINGKKK